MADEKMETAVKAKKATAASKAVEAVKAPAKKSTATKSATKTTAPKGSTAEKKPTTSSATARKSKSKINVTPEQRYLMICEAAFYKSEHRGFAPANEVQDWLEAEAEINKLLGM